MKPQAPDPSPNHTLPGRFDMNRRTTLSLAAVTGLAWLGLSGCAAFDYREADAPHALTSLEPFDPQPRITPMCA